MERIDAAVAAHLRYSLGISDYTTAAIRNAGQVPDCIRIRYSAEAAKYGEVGAGCCRTRRTPGCCVPAWNRGSPDARARRARLGGRMVDPRRGSLDTLVRTAQSLVRGGLSAGPLDDETPLSPLHPLRVIAPRGRTS